MLNFGVSINCIRIAKSRGYSKFMIESKFGAVLRFLNKGDACALTLVLPWLRRSFPWSTWILTFIVNMSIDRLIMWRMPLQRMSLFFLSHMGIYDVLPFFCLVPFMFDFCCTFQGYISYVAFSYSNQIHTFIKL